MKVGLRSCGYYILLLVALKLCHAPILTAVLRGFEKRKKSDLMGCAAYF